MGIPAQAGDAYFFFLNVWAEHLLSWSYKKQDQGKAAFYCHAIVAVIFKYLNYFKKTSQQHYITSDWIKIFSIYLQLGYKI